MLEPASRYSARRIIPLNSEGSTLYVGSPSSDLMCRVYNKTAEASLPAPDGRDLIRVEYLLRDKYADKAWMRARDGEIDGVWLSLTRRMFARSSSDSVIQDA
ncbi:replication initiation factor domain-containing protein, partial [Escherichia coli]|uniref:replication initiation factor domain-containing protein n=1 Tax=Escherichia coli TaxID=562 RepID=UPI0039C89BC2